MLKDDLFISLTNSRLDMRMYVYVWNYDQIQQRNLVMTLTKANIVDAVAKQIGYPKNQSSEMI